MVTWCLGLRPLEPGSRPLTVWRKVIVVAAISSEHSVIVYQSTRSNNAYDYNFDFFIQGYSKWLSGLHNTLEIGVCSCTDGSRNSQNFLLWCAVCSSYAFLRLERSLLRWRQTAVRGRFVCLHFITVLMFVESQRVRIQSTCKVCNKNLECCSIK